MYTLQFLLMLNITTVFTTPSCPQCPKPQTCPCNKAVNSSRCLAYDDQYFATSIDEAMFTFPNLATGDKTPLFNKTSQQTTAPVEAKVSSMSVQTSKAVVGPQGGGAGGGAQGGSHHGGDQCITADCQACKLQIINGFIENSGQTTTSSPLWQQKTEIEKNIGNQGYLCPRMQQQPQPQANLSFTAKPCDNKKKGSKCGTSSTDQLFQIYGPPPNNGKKKRDATSDTKDQLLGVSTQLGCDYVRGTLINPPAKYTGLCNLCWQWRKLPEDYFPNYLNEVSCDANDNSCLKGYGTCRPVTRTLNVLRNTGSKANPTWIKSTIDTVAACECQVLISSSIIDLVSK